MSKGIIFLEELYKQVGFIFRDLNITPTKFLPTESPALGFGGMELNWIKNNIDIQYDYVENTFTLIYKGFEMSLTALQASRQNPLRRQHLLSLIRGGEL